MPSGRRMPSHLRSRLLPLSALATLVGCAAGVQFATTQIQHPGQQLFNGHVDAEIACYRCHNGDARGSGRGPDLSGKVPKIPDEEILKVMVEGDGFMPAFGERTTDEQRRTMLAWLRETFGQTEDWSAPPVQELGDDAIEEVEGDPLGAGEGN